MTFVRLLASAWSIIALACLAPGAVAQPWPLSDLEARIQAVVSDTAFVDAFWGIHIVDLETGEVLYGQNEGNNFLPASTMKLLTTAAALDALGPDFRYTTTLYAYGRRSGSALSGHLVVRGSGDPTISDRRFVPHFPIDGDSRRVFRQWADSLRAHGITRIDGHIIADDSYFDDELLGRGWAWDDEPTHFAAQISAVSFNEGRLSLTVTGTTLGQRGTVRIEPETDLVFVANRSTTARTSESIIRRQQGGNTIWVESRVPPGQSITRLVSVHHPARYFAHVFRDVLRGEGLAVEGDPVIIAEWWRGLDAAALAPVATHRSPPLSELAAVTNKISQNLYAEHLLRTVGAELCPQARVRATAAGRDGARVRCGSAEAGLLAARDLFERAGMRVDRMRLVDGSGMSHYNMLAPVDLTALLQYMWTHTDPETRAAFIGSLAVGGVDGTLRQRFTAGPARQRVFAKTGTITGARNLAGYVTTASGSTIGFAILSNLFGTSTARVTRAQDEIVQIIARL